MKLFIFKKSLTLFRALFLVTALAIPAQTNDANTGIVGESLVLVAEEEAFLLCENILPETVVVRSTYLADKENSQVYKEGVDYLLDPDKGTLRRTAQSAIPDFSTNMINGEKEYNHVDFPGFGNSDFFVYVDYESAEKLDLLTPTLQEASLKKSKKRLEEGGDFNVIGFGDCITAGGDAAELKLQFPERYATWLGEQFPQAQIILENGETGGDSTVQGIERLEEKVLSREPDLVLVGFGMNDHNKGWIEPEDFGTKLPHIVSSIKESTGAEVILFSAFPPNPDWKHGSHRMEAYAAVTEEVASEQNCAYADVFASWIRALERKDCASLLGNNINHPSDFGHWLYFEVLKSVGF